MRQTRPGMLMGFLLALGMLGILTHASVRAASLQKKVQLPSGTYLQALHTANAFLWAWVTRDADAGLRLLSDRLRAEIKDESWLRQFVVGLSNPHHQAFEVDRGRVKATDQYVFPVTLYEYYSGEREGAEYQGRLLVIKQGDVWRVDQLPSSSDNP